jgi:DNA polymerase III delta subunit
VLVFEIGALGKLKATNLYKEIATRGGLVALDPLVGDFEDTSRLEAQITTHATALGLKLTHGAMLALLHQSAKNLGVIEQELAKLALSLKNAAAATPDGAPLPVTEHDVAEICATTSQATPFAFANALMSGEVKQALETAGTLFDRGIADAKKPGKLITRDDSILTVVLGAVAYKLTQLQDIRESLDQGRSEKDVFTQARLYYDRANEARKALRRFDASGLRRAMDALFTAFMDIRRGGAEPRAILERLVFRVNAR